MGVELTNNSNVGLAHSYNMMHFDAPLKSTLIPLRGSLDAFTRTSAASVIDFEDLIKNTLVEEARFVGARRVENLVKSTDVVNAYAWTNASNRTVTTVAAPDGTMTATRIEVTNDILPIALNPDTTVDTLVIGQKYTDSVYIRKITLAGSSVVKVTNPVGFGAANNITSVLTTSWQRINANKGTANLDPGYDGVIVSLTTLAVGDTIEVWNPQLEHVTGQTNQNPSEFISVGVGSEPDTLVDPEFDIDHADFSDGLHKDWKLVSDGSISGGSLLLPQFGTAKLRGNKVEIGKLFAFKYHITGANFTSVKLGGTTGHPTTLGKHTVIARATTLITDLVGSAGGPSSLAYVSVKEINHGSNVDAVKYFETENGNTVTSNIVTEAIGVAITTLDGVLIEEESTNVADTDDANTQIVDVSAATGDYTISCKGSASFTITLSGTSAGSISDATCTEASPAHINLTTADTITLTLDSGTLNVDNKGNNIIQVENLVYPTSFIPSSGTGSVTRSVEALTYDCPASVAVASITDLTFMCDAVMRADSVVGYAAIIEDTTTGDSFTLVRHSTDVARILLYDGVLTNVSGSAISGVSVKVAGITGDSYENLIQDGVAQTAKSVTKDFDFGTTPIISIGNDDAGSTPLNNCIKNVKLFRKEIAEIKVIGMQS